MNILKSIENERGKVYGDIKTNFEGIMMQWAPLLQPWADKIAMMEPLPPHVFAQLMTAVKLNRSRLTHHADNYLDAQNYMRFADDLQAEYDGTLQKTYYIAGKMRGVEMLNWPNFDKARDIITAAGHRAISPADIDRKAGITPEIAAQDETLGGKIAEVLLRDLAAIASIKNGGLAIIPEPDPETSEGTQLELVFARALGLELINAFTLEVWK